jgi:hypothetical protein
LSESHKGIKQSEKTKKKRSESLKGKKREPFTEETRRRMSKPKKGTPRSEEARKNMSSSHKGQVPWNKGKTDVYSEEILKNMRLSAIKRIENQNGQCIPNYNKSAISIIRAKAKELGITDLQDAETPGGEFQVCGYFVDGRSKEKNTVIEYYEKAHKYKKERDDWRKQEIINELGCKFIEIWE